MPLENDAAKAEQQFLDRIEYRKTLAQYTREQLVEMCLDLLENEKDMRELLDKLQGIIR